MARKQRGDRALALSRRTFNEFATASNFVNRNFLGQNAFDAKPEDFIHEWVPFRNLTGQPVFDGHVIGLDAPLITHAMNSRGFLDELGHSGVVPQFAQNRFNNGVVFYGAPPNKIGFAVVSGIASVFINIKAEHLTAWRPYADVVSGNALQLESSPEGAIQIISIEGSGASSNVPTAGVKRCRVLVGSHDYRLMPAVVGGAEIAANSTGIIQLKNIAENLTGHWTHATNNQALPAATEVWVQRRDDGEWDIIAPSTSSTGGTTTTGGSSPCLCRIAVLLLQKNYISQAQYDNVRTKCTCDKCFFDCDANPPDAMVVKLSGASANGTALRISAPNGFFNSLPSDCVTAWLTAMAAGVAVNRVNATGCQWSGTNTIVCPVDNGFSVTNYEFTSRISLVSASGGMRVRVVTTVVNPAGFFGVQIPENNELSLSAQVSNCEVPATNITPTFDASVTLNTGGATVDVEIP